MSPVLGNPSKRDIFVISNLRKVLVEMPGWSETKKLINAPQGELSMPIFVMDSGKSTSMT
jgi:hypothetical protein